MSPHVQTVNEISQKLISYLRIREVGIKIAGNKIDFNQKMHGGLNLFEKEALNNGL